MEVQKHPQVSSQVFPHISLDELDFRAHITKSGLVVVSKEPPIHIFSLQVTAEVSDNYTVRVHHGQYPPLKIFAHLVCLSILAEEEVYQPVDYETRVSLTGVLTAHDHDDGLVGSAYLDEGDVYPSD